MSSESAVHVLVGSQGEYSDRKVWVAAVFHDQAAARAEAERREALWREWYQHYDEDDAYRYSDQAELDVQAIDPHLDECYSYQPTYTVEEVEVR